MFKIENGRLSFYQWDINQRLIIEDASITEVHFCNRTSDCSLICEVYEEGGKRLVDVPNILLQDNWTIRVYAYCANYTKIEEKFIVFSRTKPADYIYTETEVKRYEKFEERLAALENSSPLLLDADMQNNYLNSTYYGDTALEAIKKGRQILVRVPNASGDNYVINYSPVYMYQVPNYKNEYLYLFFLRDEKQDLSYILHQPTGSIVMPVYGQLKMKLSKEYNTNPLI